MGKTQALPAGLFGFLAELKEHNDKEWFAANKARYEREVAAPALALVEALGQRIATVSPVLTADARVNGSLFRIYRDVRFSPDKRPYKTHAGIWLWHREVGKKGTGPGLYVHLEPGEVLVALGIHQPTSAQAAPIRRAIRERPDEWQAVKDALAAAGWELGGETLRGMPRGFAKDDPHARDIRRTDYYAFRLLSEAEAVRDDFAELVIARAREAAPLGAFLAEALGLPW